MQKRAALETAGQILQGRNTRSPPRHVSTHLQIQASTPQAEDTKPTPNFASMPSSAHR
jgi:hypothetical protein